MDAVRKAKKKRGSVSSRIGAAARASAEQTSAWILRSLFHCLPLGIERAVADLTGDLEDKQLLKMRRALHRRRPLDYERQPITLEVGSSFEVTRLHSCAKEPWTVAWIEAQVQPGDVFYDIGANVGAYSLIAAKHAAGQAQIFAFEPAFATYASLCRNIVANGLHATVTPLPILLCSQTGLVPFRYRQLDAGTGLHATGDRAPALKGAEAVDGPHYAQSMLGYRLDDLVRQFNLPLPHHLKLDVDGGEMEVLEGAVEVLRYRHLKSMLIELGPEIPGGPQAVVEFLDDLGLEMVEEYVPQKQGRAIYGLFTPRATVALRREVASRTVPRRIDEASFLSRRAA